MRTKLLARTLNWLRNRSLATKVILLIFVFYAVGFGVVQISAVVVSRPHRPNGVIAHRGVHIPFSRAGLTNDTCTARQSIRANHSLIENTIPSMIEAFRLGANVVELDVHLTKDGQFAVFHDWGLSCRTNGSGLTNEKTLSELKELDIAHGYSFDNGSTFPLRGSGLGEMPALSEVFDAIPHGSLLIDLKENTELAGQRLGELFLEHPKLSPRVWGVYGGEQAMRAFRNKAREIRTYSQTSTVRCMSRYLQMGWTGFGMSNCAETTVYIPLNLSSWVPGWPNHFMRIMDRNDIRVVLAGPISPSKPKIRGIDTREELERSPKGIGAWILTDRIERLTLETE